MTIQEAINNRHSVRKYKDEKINQQTVEALQTEIDACNKEGNLSIQLITNDSKSFGGFLTHYGRFDKVANFIVLSGRNVEDLAVRAGYYGERVALRAQTLGLNTCWVAATFNKKKCSSFVKRGEELVCIITLGYGITQGEAHKSKAMDQVCRVAGKMPEWFEKGMQAALLAPTGMNKQNFLFTLENENQVKVDTFDSDYRDMDKGILKYHFEMGAGVENFTWKK